MRNFIGLNSIFRRGALAVVFAICASIACVPAASADYGIAAGQAHTCAFADTGAAFCWGDNDSGQLGDGSLTSSALAQHVSGLGSGVVSIAATAASTCAVISDGRVMCWGQNLEGEMGDGTVDAQAHPLPQPVPGVTDATIIRGGVADFCVMRKDATVECWGSNASGQIGNASATDPQPTPLSVTNVSAARNLSVGAEHACALMNDLSVSCWGSDADGQLGNGAGGDSPVAQPVPAFTAVYNVYASTSTTCASTAGVAKCTGENLGGRIGNGDPNPTVQQSPVAVDAPVVKDADDMAGDSDTNCFRRSVAWVYCWGHNAGDGTGLQRNAPVRVNNASDIAVMSRGPAASHVCLIHAGGRVACWGDNARGQLGNGTAGATTSSPELATGIDLITSSELASLDFKLAGKPRLDKKRANYLVTASIAFAPQNVPLDQLAVACAGPFIATTSYKFKARMRVHDEPKLVWQLKTLTSTANLDSNSGGCTANVSFQLPVKWMNHKTFVLSGAWAGSEWLSPVNVATESYRLQKVKPLKRKKRKK